LSSRSLSIGSLALFLILASCNKAPMSVFSTGSLVILDSSQTEYDAKIEKLIGPYRIEKDAHVQDIVGYSATPMSMSRPESALGNFLVDILLDYGLNTIDSNIDMALFNKGGFRIPLPPGEIRLTHVMELMPFDNTMVVVDLSGEQMEILASTILKAGGDPISAPRGVSLSTQAGVRQFTLNGVSIDSSKSYRVLTSSYLAAGGDSYTVLMEGSKFNDSGIYVRDAIAHMFRTTTSKENPASGVLDKRIVIE